MIKLKDHLKLKNVAEYKAQAILKKADAEEKCKDLLKWKREFLLDAQELKILNGLSVNKDVVISGSSNYEKVTQVIGEGQNVSIQTN